jgi:protoheme ferro-lyase
VNFKIDRWLDGSPDKGDKYIWMHNRLNTKYKYIRMLNTKYKYIRMLNTKYKYIRMLNTKYKYIRMLKTTISYNCTPCYL